MRGARRSLLRCGWPGIASAMVLLGATAAHAADKATTEPSIWTRDTLTGDWNGTRPTLDKNGFEFTLGYIGETFSVLSGGIDRRTSYHGQFEFTVDGNLEKLIGWRGATTHVTIYQYHNSGHNALENAGSITDPSSIDAVPTTRLFTAWFEQSFNDRVWLRIGQIAADDEFMLSPTAGGYVKASDDDSSYGGLLNSTFGWAGILGANMLSGGPAAPLSAPGARVKIKAAENLTLLGAVFSGDPAGPNCNDIPERCNRHGTTFSFTGGALFMGEMQYAANQAKDLPGIYKLGFWYASANFADQHFGLSAAAGAVSLADPAAVVPLNHRGNWGVYAVADQMILRFAQESSANLFLRASASPSDRNLVSFYLDGGLGIKGALPGRPNDMITLGFAYVRIGADAAALDRDIALSSPPYPVRDHELVLEATYAAQIAPWWIVQPDVQYIVHPGGNVPDPNNPNAVIGNAFIAGLRSTIKF